jgi:hypothetical protein
MDPAAAVAVGLVALGVVAGAAVIFHRAGGLSVEVRLWWDRNRPDPSERADEERDP